MNQDKHASMYIWEGGLEQIPQKPKIFFSKSNKMEALPFRWDFDFFYFYFFSGLPKSLKLGACSPVPWK